MRVIILLLSVMLATTVLAEKTFVVQSNNLTELYGDSIIRELRQLRPDDSLRVLFLRDVNRDKFSLSQGLMASEIQYKTESYDNVILLGNDLSYLAKFKPSSLNIPILATSDTGIIGPAAPANMLAGIKQAQLYTASNENIYVLSDNSVFSRFRLRQFKDAAYMEDRLNLIPLTVKTTTGLRASLLSLNKLEAGFIVNNLFFLRDDDSMRDVYIDTTGKLIAALNKTHVEVGILRRGLPTAIGFGALADHIVLSINAAIGGEIITLPYYTGVNLDRLSYLRINNYVLENASDIVYITVDKL